MSAIAIIPARFASSRFPGKPLIDISGKTMLQRVYAQVVKLKLLKAVIIATDDKRIFDHARTFTEDVVMTSNTHLSGTDRCSEALDLIETRKQQKFDIVLNIQGDLPFIHPEQIALLYHCFDKPETKIGTLIKKIIEPPKIFDPNLVKVVINKKEEALYFSRNPIPFQSQTARKDWTSKHDYYKHIGIYGFRAETLRKLTKIKASPLELAESLEQLRWLEYGYKIQTALTERESLSIDRPEDLQQIL